MATTNGITRPMSPQQLHRLMQARGWSIAKVGNFLGVSERHVRRLLTGQHPVSQAQRTLLRLHAQHDRAARRQRQARRDPFFR